MTFGRRHTLCGDSDPNGTNLYLPISSGAIGPVILGSSCFDPLAGIGCFRGRLEPNCSGFLWKRLSERRHCPARFKSEKASKESGSGIGNDKIFTIASRTRRGTYIRNRLANAGQKPKHLYMRQDEIDQRADPRCPQGRAGGIEAR
jgi:hypothetical protein